MEHSVAIMEDAGAAIDAAVAARRENSLEATNEPEDEHSKNDSRKRKKDFRDESIRHGGRGNNKRYKKSDMGRSEYFRGQPDKREKNQHSREKREAGGGPGYGKQFSQTEIDADERRPKRKVAVMIGYSGTGYKGMQISASQKTIEGDLFDAFIAAGAISKANANDPKKVSLVRCARTDKGVHAAGNMISLKLIIEDEDVVQKINANLSPQIRVWGLERTTGSFSCYQACDSRWYEYLIPSHAFLPPHPSSWLAKKLEEHSGDASAKARYESRQEEVKGFWERVDEEEIKPILESIDEDIRWDVVKALQGEDEASAKATQFESDAVQPRRKTGPPQDDARSEDEMDDDPDNSGLANSDQQDTLQKASTAGTLHDSVHSLVAKGSLLDTNSETTGHELTPEEQDKLARLRMATKKLRVAYTAAKRKYRIPPQRIERIQEALNRYLGTNNYHNYTIQKTFRDPSAKRHIKSFLVNRKPILIGEGDDSMKTEWLSMKVHGQSFMMHQIRKMVGMVSLIVRCGADPATMTDSFGDNKYSIPKVPGLGLLLERPVFDSYNNLQAAKHEREPLLFSKYEAELEAFKEREIYQRIFREEETRNEFGRFFNHIDNFKMSYFLFVTSGGWQATQAAGTGEGTQVSSETLEKETDSIAAA